MRLLFDVYGMSCQVCANRINKAVNKVNGVNNCNVNFASNSMLVDYDEKITNSDIIIKAVVQAGYNAKIKSNVKASTKKELNFMVVRVIVSLVFLIPLLYITMFYDKFPHPEFISYHRNPYNFVNYTICLVLLTVPVILVNFEFFRKGYKNLFKLDPSMDTLISIGSTASFLYSFITFTIASIKVINGDNGEYISNISGNYFDSSAMILTIVTFGKMLESKAKHKTTVSIDKLVQLIPEYAIKIENGEEISVSVEDIKIGDIILVKTGTRVPVDGIVVEGEATLDTSTITGESVGTYAVKGTKVISSSLNQNGLISIQATTIGADSSMQKIIDLVNEAANSKAPISRIADKVSNFFVPIVIFISLCTFIIWWLFFGDISTAVKCSVSVLVISCPCALGLATPVAIMTSVGKGTQFGIISKSAEAIEMASEIDTVILDKTGTITEGTPSVIGVNNYGVDEQEVIQVSYSLENGMVHPLSNAIIEFGKKSGYKPYKVENSEYIPGMGIKGKINGRNYFLGNAEYVQSYTRLTNVQINKFEEYSKIGAIPLLLTKENEVVGIVCLYDKIKDSSIQAVKELQALGLNVVMATGDGEHTARSIGDIVNIKEVRSRVLPQDKEKIIKEYQGYGKHKKKVAMIGDGINDSIALVRSDLGVAIGNGSDIAIDYGDVVLLRSDLLDATNMFRLARRTMNAIKLNLFWALGYNLVLIPLATGLITGGNQPINPMMSSAAMCFSSLLVVCSALTINLFKPIQYKKSENEIIKKPNNDNMLEEEKENIMEKVVKVNGMSCEHCSARVKKAIEALPNVKNVEVNLKTKEVKIQYEESLNLQSVKEAVENIDYEFLG